ncbi:MAG: glycosyltransferase family 9 protein [Prevotella sp.]|nr:glycosyltransferase family 9 protein [Prevotella sp.]
MKTEHILIMRFSAMGDVAMMVPVVYSLAMQHPHVRITVLSRPFARPFFENLAPNVYFMGADVVKEYKGVKGLNTLYRRLIAKKFTAIADFHDVLRTKYLRTRYTLAGYKVAHINKHRAEKHRLTRQHNKQLQPIQSAFENYADVLRKLGYPVELKFNAINNSGNSQLNLLPEQLKVKPERERWIGIAPFAAHRGKIYPIEKTRQVVSMLVAKHPDWKLFFFGGGQKEMDVINQWTEQYPQTFNASQMLKGLSAEIEMMAQLDTMLSMDSANMHLASLVGTPVVSIWGATHPYAGFLGWNQKASNVIQKELECRPCSIYGSKKCFRNDYACLHTIEPEEIVAKIEENIKP